MIKSAKVFASANELKRISKPLQSRFRKIFLPRYSQEQFIEVSVKVLKHLSTVLLVTLVLQFTKIREI